MRKLGWFRHSRSGSCYWQENLLEKLDGRGVTHVQSGSYARMSPQNVSSVRRGGLRRKRLHAAEERRTSLKRERPARKSPPKRVHNALDEQDRPHRRPEPHLLKKELENPSIDGGKTNQKS